MRTKKTLSILICSFLLLSGCKNPFEAKDKGAEQLNNLENRWVDTLTLASSTSRIALAQPISQLQEIKRDLLNTEVSECLNPARKDLSMYMDQHINNFLKFMANDNNTQAQNNPELINYLAIKAKCTGEKTNTNKYLITEAQVIEMKLKAEEIETKRLEKIAKQKGISVSDVIMEEATAAVDAAAEATTAAEDAAAATAR